MLFVQRAKMKIFPIERWNTLCVLAPWLLFGAFLIGFLHVAVPANWLRKNLQGKWGVAEVVFSEIRLPLCSWGLIPPGIGHKNVEPPTVQPLGY